jgi:thiol-disulfide isomerase/thioredoxin
MKLAFSLTFLLIIFLGCKNKNQSPAETASENIESTEIQIEDPFSETNLVDNIELVDLDGNPIDLKTYAGKKIFLNFWATWCKPCILEMPSIERAEQQLQEDGYIFLLASDETVGRINRFKASKDFDLHFIRVETPFPDIGILSLPTTLIIDETGRIAFNQVGAMEWDSTEVLEKLRNLTGEADS